MNQQTESILILDPADEISLLGKNSSINRYSKEQKSQQSQHNLLDDDEYNPARQIYKYPSHAGYFDLEHNERYLHQISNSTKLKHPQWFEFINKETPKKFKYDSFNLSLKHQIAEEKKQSKTSERNPQEIVIKLNHKKPPQFMGAFSHVQTQFKWLDFNVSLPSLKQYQPFSRFLSQTDQNILKNSQIIEQSLPVENKSQIQKQKSKGYFFEQQSIKSEFIQEELPQGQLQISKIEEKDEFNNNQSIFLNYESLFKNHKNIKLKSHLWESKQDDIFQKGWSKGFQVYHDENIKVLAQIQEQINLPQDTKYILSDAQLIIQIAKMLQNAQTRFFTLDYHTMTWSLNLKKHRLQHSFRNSLASHLQDIFELANYKSRLLLAENHIKKMQYRKLLHQMGLLIFQVNHIIEGIILDHYQNSQLIQFIVHVTDLKLEIKMLYKLLINEAFIVQEQKSFMDFDYSFLNSEFMIFTKIIKLSKENDSVQSKISNFINKLLIAAFKPITFALDRIIFEESPQTSLQNEIYLKYYFENIKDIINFLGKKIQLIKNQSNDLYLICKIKETIEIVTTMEELQDYQKKWNKVFVLKFKSIEKMKKKHKKQLKLQQERKKEARMKEIYELKLKLYNALEEENIKKAEYYQRSKEELQKLKKDIEQAEERRRLSALIEKQKQKGYLLQNQLIQKKNLQKQKESLVNLLKKESKEVQQKPNPNEMKDQKEQIIAEIDPKPIQAENKSVVIPIVLQKEGVRHFHQNKQKPKKKLKKIGSIIKRTKHQIDADPQNESSSSEDQINQVQQSLSSISSEEQEEEFSVRDVLSQSKQVNTVTSLQICINSVIKRQTQVIQTALSFIVFEKHRMLKILQLMRLIFMSGNGEKVQQFITLAITTESTIKLKYFHECLLFDSIEENLRQLHPQFYQMKMEEGNGYTYLNNQVSIFTQNLEQYIGFQFKKLPYVLEAYFSYIHLSKYMQIFTFIIRLKHTQNLISESWKLLNGYKKQFFKNGINKSEFQHQLLYKLYATRHIIQNFLTTFMNYLFFKVIEKEFRNFRKKLSNPLNELSAHHLKMLDNIIRFGFIDNPVNDISKQFRRLLAFIRQFKNIVDMFCLDDLPQYLQEETQNKVKFIDQSFKKNQNFFQNLLFKN